MKHVINLGLHEHSGYLPKIEKIGQVLNVKSPYFDVNLSELENEAIVESFLLVFRRIRKEMGGDVCLHLSEVDGFTSLVAIRLKGEGWTIFNKSLDLSTCDFHLQETPLQLLVNTYKTFYPYTKKF